MTHDWDLVMPFVVVESNGGPFNDVSYCAGYECGLVDAALSVAAPNVNLAMPIVREQNLPQLDLIAMRYNFAMKITTPAADGWCAVEFTR